MIYGEQLLALAAWAADGKCAKTHIIVDWSVRATQMGAVIAVLAMRENGFLHQKFNIFLATKASH